MPLTILQYITPSRLAGAEYFFLRVVEHLARKGHRIIVVTKRDTPLRAEVEKLVPLGVELHAWHTHGKFDPPTLRKLCRLIQTERVDLINTHLTTAAWQGALAGKWTGVPSVAVVHATDRKTWFQHADHLIAVSGGVKSVLIEQGIAPEKIEVLYHGIELEKYVAPLSARDAKIRLGLNPEARVVGVLASLIPRKGHRFLLEALANLQKEFGPIHAIFAGEGELEGELKALAGRLGLRETTHFLGFRRDVPELVCAFDAFVLPSLKEGLSIAVMEAMALEKPVICSNIAGLPEVVRDGETGILSEPGDVQSLENALRFVFQSPHEARQLGRNARRFLEENFEQTACLDAMEDYFERVAVQQNAPVGVAPPAFGRLPEAPPAFDETKPMAPLHIAQLIAPSKISGAERLMLSLCRGLEARGHRVEFLVKWGHELRDVAEAEGLRAHGLRFGGKLNLMALRRLSSWFRREQIDLVATQLSTASLWGTLAARVLGLPSVATVHALNSKTCYVYADLIIAVSEAVKIHLVEQGVESEKIRVVYNGIDLEKFPPPLDVGAAKSRLGLAPDAPTLGVVAHLSAKKGHAWFLRALAPILSSNRAIQILFLGEGPLETELRALCAELQIESQVHFLGFLPDVVPIISAMDIVVLPTIAKEGFGRVLVEGGALKKPVIGTDIGGIGEVIEDGETGFVIEPGDAQRLQEIATFLLENPTLREQMGEAGWHRAHRLFSQQMMVEQTERVYREAMAMRGRAF